jgi:hypothetical protein
MNMRRAIATLWSALFVSVGPSFGHAEAANPYLYKIEGGTGTSFLMGTFHYGVRLEDYAIDIASLIRSANVLMVEEIPDLTDIAAWENDFTSLVTRSMNARPEPKIPLDSDTLQAYVRFGVPEVAAQKTSDDYCLALITMYEFAFAKPLPLDLEIAKIALASGIHGVALDTKPLREKALEGEHCSLKKEFAGRSPEIMRQQYLDDIHRLIKSFKHGGEPSDTESDDPVASVRNVGWMDAIAGQLKAGPTFIAVGEGHLGGNQGLIQLLQARGFKVTRVPRG